MMPQSSETRIRRRRYLASVGAVLGSVGVAGCGGSPDDEDSDSKPTNQQQETSTSTETLAPEDQETDTAGEAEIEFGELNLVYESEGSEEVAYAEFVAENVGNADSGTVEVTIEWIDESGSFLGEDLVRGWTIGEGERWIGQVKPRGAEPDMIDDFEITTKIQTEPPTPPAGIEVAESSVEIRGEFDRVILGTAESTADEPIESVRARGKIYNSQGDIIGTATQHEYDGIPSDRDWNFELELRDRAGARAEEAGKSVVILDSRT